MGEIWSFVPYLCFDIADFMDKDAEKVTDSVFKKFRNFVSMFLLRDEASDIHTFRLLYSTNVLECQETDDLYSDEMAALDGEWVLHALRHNLKILEVSSFRCSFLDLPDCFFTCESLEHMILCFSLDLDVKPKRVCLPRLRTLSLDCTDFYNSYLETFLLGCPALENLSMEYCMMNNFSCRTVKRLQLIGCTIDPGTISAPAAEVLYFHGDMERMSLKDASGVISATFSSSYITPGYEYTGNLLSSLSSVEYLVIDVHHLKQMLERELPKCPTFLSLWYLTLGRSCIACAFGAVPSFLDHCPKLEKLILLHNVDHFCQASGDHSVEEIKWFPCGLKTVEIMYSGSDCTMSELVGLIMQRTSKIKGVQIILTKRVRDDEEGDQN